MGKILCSTGALLGRPNNRDYRLLKELAPQLECDGFEFMVYGSWYPELENLISTVKSMGLQIPVIHCQKALSEKICGKRVWFENNQFLEQFFTEEEDRILFSEAKQEFSDNLRIANEFGATKMVFHLWNGLPSDQNLQKNIERFGELDEMAKNAGVTLMVENVVCNAADPLSDLVKVYESYPEVSFVYDTKMAEFHEQTLKVFESEYEWIFRDGHVKHLHVNDYDGGYKDWSNLNVLPIGKGHVDFDKFFVGLSKYGYQGDFTVEATGFDSATGKVDIAMLNKCFGNLRSLIQNHF